ncbi:hypothetical protein PoB_000057400 [Plakobranchus ocellatus]|uniref:TCTP domain-containing protein n=1 Tax=Plakobranchus ocellatus TaxID=259542 RepID=A0AAV3XSF5_9GAST|nr:hypothetical protein PoB_000057400 [Plakobranchus ocellatus]
MKLFKCLLTEDELFSDGFSFEEKDGLIIVKGKATTKSQLSPEESFIGGNTNAEEPQNSANVEESTEVVCNIIAAFRLEPKHFYDKRDYMIHFKQYISRLVETKRETQPDLDSTKFREEMISACSPILENYEDYEFFGGESLNPSCMSVALKWEKLEGQSEKVPYCYFFKEGLVEEIV